jgi:hypothetical protein
VARPESDKGIVHFIVSLEDMTKFKAIELLLMFSNLLTVCLHVGVMTVRLPHDLVDDELRVTTDVKPLDPKLDGDAQAVDEGLIVCTLLVTQKCN